MNEIENSVRLMLTERADAVPERYDLLSGVRRTIRRRRTRRRVVTGSALAVALLAAGTATWSVHGPDDHLVPADRPPSPVTASATPVTGLTAPASPISLGRLPDGFGPPTVTLDSPFSWTLTATRPSPPATIEVQVSTEELTARDGAWQKYANFSTIEIAGTKASLATVPYHPGWPDASHQSYLGAYFEVTYQRKPRQWVRIEAYDRDHETLDPKITMDDLQVIATGLADRPSPVTDLLRFPALPANLTIGALAPDHEVAGTASALLVYAVSAPAPVNRPYGATQWDLTSAPIAVLVGADQYAVTGLGANPKTFTSFQVDGHEVRRYGEGYPGRWVLTTSFGRDRTIALSVMEKFPLSEKRAARTLLAIRPGADFR
ncbi:hypothetical protein [Cryptosporangium sp. NPDC051539]|uniref:hypothetical protein n=1 Tax=Cryptosporangium sp. NPDC051539 TaxID=3363962 RepID=UPI003788690F